MRQLLFAGFFFSAAIIITSPTPLSAQPDNSRQIDSLKALFPKQEGVEKIESLFELARLVADYDLDSAIYLDSMALDFLKDSYQSLWHVKLLADLSYFYRLKFDYGNTKMLLDSALLVAKHLNSKKGLTIVYNDLGCFFLELNLYDSALHYYQQSLKHEERLNDRSTAIILNNIGLIHNKMENCKTAIDYFSIAKELNLKNGDLSEVFSNCVNTGLAYLQLREIGLAKINFTNAIQIGISNNSVNIAHAYDGLGQVYTKLNEMDSAREYLLLAINAGLKFNDKRIAAYSYSHLAELEYMNDAFELAKYYIEKSQKLYKQVGDKIITSHNFRLYSQIYEALGQPDSAYYYHKKHLAIQDSIFTPKLTHNLTNLQLSYQAEESRQVIEEKEQRLSQTTKYLWLAGMVLLICVVQLFRFYHRFL